MLMELWDGLTVDEAAGGPPRVTTSDPRSTAASPRKEALLTEGASRLSPLGFHPEEVSTAVGPGGPTGSPGVSDLLPPHRLFSHEGCGFS